MVQILGVIPVFLLLLQDPTAPRYVPSIYYNFTITPKPSPGQSWCEIQGQCIRATFFKYTCSSQKIEPIGPLGMKLNATEAWNQLVEHWKDLMEELRKALLDNTLNISKDFRPDPFSLQGSMMCDQEYNRFHQAFWNFGFHGRTCLCFEPKDRCWKELGDECGSLKETLDSAQDLLRISAADCGPIEEAALDTKDAPTTDPATIPSKAMTITPTSLIIFVGLICLIILSCVLL